MEENTRPGLKELRVFGGGLGLLAVVLGVLHWREHRGFPWQLPWAAAIWFLALVVPDVFEPLYRLWKPAATKLARLLGRTFLALFFYGVLTPYSWLLKLCRVRLLDLKLRDRDSYWVVRAEPRSPDSYRGEF